LIQTLWGDLLMATGFGIIGCGMISRFHARAIQEIKGAKLVACYNHSPQKALDFAKEFGCQAYQSLDELLAQKDVDVVTICTPSGAHLEPGLAAAKAGKHILVEKPLEVTTARCDRLIDACKSAGVKLATIFPSRFHESSQLLKKAVDSDRFGVLTLGDAYVKWFRTQQYYDSGAWRGTWKLDGGGALMNQAIHSVDLLLWLMGPVVEVSAFTSTLAHERIEESIVKWEFAKASKADEKIRAEMASKTKTGGGAADPAAIGHHGHRELFREFLTALKVGREPISGGDEGRKAVELITAIYRSAKSGKRVKVGI
jgi:predicted dehydrogenase